MLNLKQDSTKPKRYIIRDCMGAIVGNPKGYATMRGAMMVERKSILALVQTMQQKQATDKSAEPVQSLSTIKQEFI